MNTDDTKSAANFIDEAIAEDLRTGRYDRVITRFPPEPNAYLHIGHAKAICIDFGLAEKYGGYCNLRMDDTNPEKEEQRYVDAIKADVAWLGFEWRNLFHASDYFDQLYEWARALIEAGKAYVDDQSAEQVRQTRGTLTEPGQASPYRDRAVDENLDLFERMRAGEFPDGTRTLRAKIEMASPNLNLRDPVMYRILHKPHPHVGDKWCIYPSYDWTHGQSDWIEGVTHSLCSLEFEDHRPLYDWFLEQLIEAGCESPNANYRPRQIEFARGNITYTVTSKRRLVQLVDTGHVDGYDDPRMPTLAGLRRRGFPPAAIRRFWEGVGVAKRENNIEFPRLEHAVRDELNRTAQRRAAVLKPLKIVITNWPEGEVDQLEAVNNPEDESAGTRHVPFSGTLYIERDDFKEDPPRKFFRLAPGREVRLRYAYFITCNEVIKNDAGEVVELRCTYDPETRGGDAPDGRKVKGTLHWVSVGHAVDAEVRLYDHLFTQEDPTEAPDSGNWLDNVNDASLEVIDAAKLEPSLTEFKPGEAVQFERLGYFTPDSHSTPDKPVFNRTVSLRDTWAKMQKQGGGGSPRRR